MAIFDKEALEYDAWYQSKMGSYVFKKESALLEEMIGDYRNKTILEVGCATGIHSRLFSRKDNKITGVDLSKEMITVAKQYEKENLKFHVMDALHLDFEDNTFDIVFSATMIEFVKDRSNLLKELKRVLKEDGVIVIGTIQKGSHFYDLYQTPFFQENTVFQYADFLDEDELKGLGEGMDIMCQDCLYDSAEDIEEKDIKEDLKKDKVGSFLVCRYQKGEL